MGGSTQPMFKREEDLDSITPDYVQEAPQKQLRRVLSSERLAGFEAPFHSKCAPAITPGVKWLNAFAALPADVRLIRENDPALHSFAELIFCYPSLYILFFQRIAHVLYKLRLFFLARLLSTLVRIVFGADVHPGATIYPGVFIDHALGVVIGESAVVGSGAIIYQNSTLGGTGNDTSLMRHPIVGEGTVVGAGAKVLGGIVVGRDCRVGAGSVVVKSVPHGCTVVGIPARVVRGPETGLCRKSRLHHELLPDVLLCLENRVSMMSKAIVELQQQVFTAEKRAAAAEAQITRVDSRWPSPPCSELLGGKLVGPIEAEKEAAADMACDTAE